MSDSLSREASDRVPQRASTNAGFSSWLPASLRFAVDRDRLLLSAGGQYQPAVPRPRSFGGGGGGGGY